MCIFKIYTSFFMVSFYDCGFHSVCPLMEKDKRLMETSWWESLTRGETGSCSAAHGVAKSRAWLSNWTELFMFTKITSFTFIF